MKTEERIRETNMHYAKGNLLQIYQTDRIFLFFFTYSVHKIYLNSLFISHEILYLS